MIQITTISETAQEIIEYLQIDCGTERYLLTVEPSVAAADTAPPTLSPDEEEKLLDELGTIGKGRLDPSLTYDRNDIYFDR